MFDFLKKKNKDQKPKKDAPVQMPAYEEQQSAPPLTNPDKKPKKDIKKTLLMIGAIVGGLFIVYLVFAFITIAMAEEGKDFTLTKMFGMQAAVFLNMLVTGIHIIILLIALVAFGFLMTSLFKMLLAKKDQPEKKKKAKKGLIIYGVILGVILIAWITAFVYLESRRDTLKINIEYPPIVTEPEDTLQLTAPITIKFDASHAPVDSSQFQILSYDWDFGDKETGTSQIVTHEYTKKGRYDVILAITKRGKATGEETKDTYSKTITIANQALTATFKADPQSGEAPLKVKFDASDSVDPDGEIGSYEWDLDGDGEFDEEYNDEVEVEYEYEKIGTYDVMLRVTSLAGEYNVANKQIIVGMGETPDAVIEVEGDPETFEKGVTYIFKAGESTSPNGKIEKYDWDFGDGTALETTKTVSHKFIEEGVYQVILKVTDEEEQVGETLLQVILGEKPGMPSAVIKTSPELQKGALSLEGEVPFKVEFDGSESTDFDDNIVDYEWDFDDDGKADSFGKKVTHSFIEEGVHTVRLTVVDTEENYDSETIGIKVVPQGMNAALTAEPLSGEVPMTVKFDASGSYHPGADISSYKWDFGDGTNPILGSAKINHKYTEIGEYTASVTVIGTDNAKDTAEAHIVVREVQVSACFAASPTSGKAPLGVSLDPDCSTGTITSYDWTFGDGETSSDVKPTHTFTNPGIYPVTLEVLDNNNTVSTTTIDIEVQP
jgi:PKD repeat protein